VAGRFSHLRTRRQQRAFLAEQDATPAQLRLLARLGHRDLVCSRLEASDTIDALLAGASGRRTTRFLSEAIDSPREVFAARAGQELTPQRCAGQSNAPRGQEGRTYGHYA